MPSMVSSGSLQLPDLLALTRRFELRTNRHCRSVTSASETWLLGQGNSGVLSAEERESLHSYKLGLLASLCCPTGDAPQLRLLADFLSLLVFSRARLLHARDTLECGWSVHEGRARYTDGVECLSDHTLFRNMTSRIQRLASIAPQSWQAQFAHSTTAFRDAQLQIFANRTKNITPDLEGYIELRRNASGLKMVFDLIELAAGPKPPTPGITQNEMEQLKKLRHCAADIIAWSLDIVSYNSDQTHRNKHNIVAVLMAQKGLSIQGAVNFAASLIKDSFASFLATERSLLASVFTPPPPPTQKPSTHHHSRSYSWSWGFGRTSSPPPVPEAPLRRPSEETLEDCVQILRDCIVGTLNWVYETELYFGQRGEEIRAYGWVFLNPRLDGPSSSE